MRFAATQLFALFIVAFCWLTVTVNSTPVSEKSNAISRGSLYMKRSILQDRGLTAGAITADAQPAANDSGDNLHGDDKEATEHEGKHGAEHAKEASHEMREHAKEQREN